jgi:hypothetical protein
MAFFCLVFVSAVYLRDVRVRGAVNGNRFERIICFDRKTGSIVPGEVFYCLLSKRHFKMFLHLVFSCQLLTHLTSTPVYWAMKYVFNLKRMRVAPMMVDITARQKQWEAAGRTLVARLDAAVPPLTPDQLTAAYSNFVQNVRDCCLSSTIVSEAMFRLSFEYVYFRHYYFVSISVVVLLSPFFLLVCFFIFSGDC